MIKYQGKIIVIAGTTASGKSSLALKLAKDINGIIINGDSRQIYKEISIGTSKPSIEEMNNIPHYLYSFVSVKEKYNIYKYQKDVSKILSKLPQNVIPIIVGGTGLYIDSVIYNYNLSKETKGKELKHIYFVVDKPKDVLKENIRKRVNAMFDKGLLEENRKLSEQGLSTTPVLRTIGYAEFDNYFKGEKTLDEVKDEIVKNTIDYAKRQRTWFRRNKEAIWESDYNILLDKSNKFIKTL
ncbi:MAG: tRNA (adenosine(37)-N6)-dimethylallyltransferase MiaA [Candidatus Dojkabacteria bacterium]|nr:tRNA (adenosine(37)-N6)-dimethylallyltransferase MiaA [Candidatus Dojkabacteria bacterium]